MALFASAIASALVVPTPLTPASQQLPLSQQLQQQQQPALLLAQHASSTIFPVEDGPLLPTSSLLAMGPPKEVEVYMRNSSYIASRHQLIAILLPILETQQKVYTEEEKADARNKGLLVLFFGAAPSFWAQNELVWNKEKLDDARAKTKSGGKKKNR